jgi:spoIIIJ-associated protein
MKAVEIKAKSVEEAIYQALDQLGVSQDEVKVTVLSEGKAGILGLGAEEARVRVELLAPTPGEEDNAAEVTADADKAGDDIEAAEAAREVLETLLSRMGVPASVTIGAQPAEEAEVTPIVFNIAGDDLGILIGRRGETLACLQYMVRLIMAQQRKAWLPIFIDVGGYKERRYEALRSLASRIAEQVKLKRAPFPLEPMPAYERRIVHLALADSPDVTTESVGVGEVRKVVILPKDD